MKNLSPFKCLCMSVGTIPTSYVECMSYYECVTFLVKFLENQVIPAINNNNEAVKELQEYYVELKNYVDNYFDNLDIQEEINNKLDDMAESGQLAEIISQYLNLACILSYDTISDMKLAENLNDGSIAKTLGYYSINDNGGALYKIREKTVADVINEGSIVSLLDDTLVAELVSPIINVKMFGVVGDGATDDTENLQNALNYTQNNKLYLNNETYCISEYLQLSNNNLIGNETTIKALSTFTSNYMLNLENSNEIKNIVFDNNNYSISTNNQNATDEKLVLENCEFIHTKKYVREDNFALNGSINLTARESYMNNCKVYNNNSHGAKLICSQSGAKAYIKNSEFNYNGNYDELITAVGLVSYESDIFDNYKEVVIENCIAHDNANSGIAPHGVYNCVISNCNSYNNLEHGYVLMEGINGKIVNCTAKNNSAYGIRIQGGYTDFVLDNNSIEGTGGIYISEDVNTGIISNNIIKGHITNTSFGIVISNDDLASTDNIQNLNIINNMFTGSNLSKYNSIYTYFKLNENNNIENNIIKGKTDNVYYIKGNKYRSYITPKLKYSNVYDNINTSYNDMSTWTANGVRTDNTFTVVSQGVCRKTFEVNGAPKYINAIFDINNYTSKISFTLRFRNESDSLINFTTPDGLTTNNLSLYDFLKGNITSRHYNLENFIFADDVAKIELFVQTEGTADMTINNVYVSLSSENTVINS